MLARAAQLYPEPSLLTPALFVLTGAKFAVMFLMAAVLVICGGRLAWRKKEG